MSVGLHLFRLGFPASPAFDERYFATYAADYRLHRAFIDVHPPLGKIIYALPLFLFDQSHFEKIHFIDVKISSTGQITPEPYSNPYGAFPYLTLRFVSALFGVLLVFAIYYFLKNLTQNESIALLGMFFAVFENAILVDTRFILLNGMYLSFAFLALALILKQKPRPILGGVLWGLSLSVKLIAVTFLAPLIVAYFFKKGWLSKRQIILFIAIGFFVLALVWFFGNLLFIPATDRVTLHQPIFTPNNTQIMPATNSLLTAIKATTMEILFSAAGYTSGGINPKNVIHSYWYAWPLMYKPISFFHDLGKQIVSAGNPTVWIFSLLTLLSLIWRAFRKTEELKNDQPTLILASGYIASILPFVFVNRATYIYHYLPAFIFSLCLAALFFEKYLQTEGSQNKILPLVLTISAVVLGFVVVAPFTYGL